MTEPVRKYLTSAEVERLLVRFAPKCDKLLIQMGLTLGCRVSEITSLRLRNIKGRLIKVWDEKKDEYRQCVIDTSTEAMLEDYLETDYSVPSGMTREHQRLFYISNKTANRRVKEAFQEIGVPEDVPHRWHTLRHTYVRLTLDRMKDRGIQFVCEQTGDSPETILKVYGVPSLEDRLEAAEFHSITQEGSN